MPLTIGAWTVEPATNELRRGATVVRVEPKAMDVLALLAEHAGAVVSREQFLARIWAGAVVGDEALTQSITKLRRALGDDPQSPAYIETIAKRGYRLVAPVRRFDAPAGASPAAGDDGPSRRPAIALAGIALVALALVLLLAVPRAGRIPTAAPAVEEPFLAVTVLPFASLGAGHGDDYLARGIGDDLMTALGSLSGLRVVVASDAAHAARYVISGSVQRDSGTLRINVRVVDRSNGEQLWSERFERRADEFFALQDEIAAKVARSLPARLDKAERSRLAKRYTRSIEAYDEFLRAQALFLVRGRAENRQARALYENAVGIDPRFARAYAGLAMTYAIDHRLRGVAARPDDLQRARSLAQTARQIDPDIAEVHWALAFVDVQAGRPEAAIAPLERAIALNPSFADAYALMAGVDTYLGEPAKSIPLLRIAMRLKPDAGYLYYLLLGRAYLFAGDVNQALINLKEAVARNPADLESHAYLAAASAAAGERNAADWEAQEVRAIDRDFTTQRWLATYPLTSAPHRARLRALLAEAGLP